MNSGSRRRGSNRVDSYTVRSHKDEIRDMLGPQQNKAILNELAHIDSDFANVLQSGQSMVSVLGAVSDAESILQTKERERIEKSLNSLKDILAQRQEWMDIAKDNEDFEHERQQQIYDELNEKRRKHKKAVKKLITPLNIYITLSNDSKLTLSGSENGASKHEDSDDEPHTRPNFLTRASSEIINAISDAFGFGKKEAPVEVPVEAPESVDNSIDSLSSLGS
jgi:hypothetical protein